MRKLVTFAFALGASALAGGAQAFPLPPAPDAATVQTVAGGCGWGFHRGPWGGCRPNGAVVVTPPVVVAPRPVVVAPPPVVVVPAQRCWWRAGPYGAVRVCN